MEKNTDILSRKQAAAFLGVCRNTLDSLDVPRTKVGRRVLFNCDAIIKWFNDHTEKSVTRRRGNKGVKNEPS